MKAGWTVGALETLCEFKSGLWKGEQPPFVHVGVIRNTNFTREGVLDDSEIAYLDVEAKKFASRRLLPGDIILEKSGGGPKQPVGRVVLFDKSGEFSFSNFTSALRVRDPRALDARYLHRFLFWVHLSGKTEAMQSHSTGIRNLNGDAYRAIQVPIPPLPEQRRIVGILDKAFEAIAVAKANAERELHRASTILSGALQEYFCSIEMLPSIPIGSVAEVYDGPHATPRTVQSGPIFLGIDAIQNGIVSLGRTRHVTEADFLRWTRRVTPRADDIVFSYETRLGEAAVIPEELRCCLGRRMGLVRVDPSRVDPRFFVYQYISPPFRSFLAGRTVRGATVDRIPLKEFPSFGIRLPGLAEQRRQSARFAQLRGLTDQIASALDRKCVALDLLKQSMLHQAFSGAL